MFLILDVIPFIYMTFLGVTWFKKIIAKTLLSLASYMNYENLPDHLVSRQKLHLILYFSRISDFSKILSFTCLVEIF